MLKRFEVKMMPKKSKTYSPQQQETQQQIFNVIDSDYFVSKDTFTSNKEHVNFRLDELTKSVELVPSTIKDNLEKFELQLESKQTNNKKSFWFQIVPLITGVLALLVSVIALMFK